MKDSRKGANRKPLFRTLTVTGGTPTRTCGTCTACCTPYIVAELDKPAGVTCQYVLPEGGCGCYHERPAPCRRFQCLWLKDLLPDGMRPDEVGYIVATNWLGGFLQVNEMVPGATENCPRFRAWRDELSLRDIELHIVPPIEPPVPSL